MRKGMDPVWSFDEFLKQLESRWRIHTSDEERHQLGETLNSLESLADERELQSELEALARQLMAEGGTADDLNLGDEEDDDADEEVPTDPAFYLSADEEEIAELVQLHVEMGRLGKAWEVVTRALQYRHYSPELLWWKASLLAAKGKFEEAEAALQEAISLSPDDDRIVATYIELLIIQGRFQQAEQWLQEWAAREEVGPELAMIRVIYHLVRRQPEQAMAAFEAGISEHPYLEQWAEMAVIIYRMMPAGSRIFRFLTSLYRRYPEFLPPLVALGNLYLLRKQWDAARTHYLKALEIDPTVGEIYLRLSIIAIQQGQKKQALKYLEKAHEWGWDWNAVNAQGFSLIFDQAMHRFLGRMWDDLFGSASSENNDSSNE